MARVTRDIRLVPIAAAELLRARVLLALRPGRVALTLLDTGPGATPLEPAERAWLEGLRWALGGCAKWLPFRTDCLVRSAAGGRILRRRGLPFRTHLQVGRLPSGAFEAHAWIECDGTSLVGGPMESLVTVEAGAERIGP
ncbi:lasso peptide biosynthesis B2 protein [Tropicimonas sp. IMCC6043]|uniref:lasso peptide biosynthesis B2 protein n=1 Tax=Tropicimonas sp. IMCC6043 TaxID=2510645 RepID=UPI00101C5C21|nr:lasso peptide biosynthesis B2 protein [Tropicimonas sp. IMCC6043]RYH07503.1 lasso peptide biosynthesis B2 protein [Tropicimonas sp. IMCC6043]